MSIRHPAESACGAQPARRPISSATVVAPTSSTPVQPSNIARAHRSSISPPMSVSRCTLVDVTTSILPTLAQCLWQLGGPPVTECNAAVTRRLASFKGTYRAGSVAGGVLALSRGITFTSSARDTATTDAETTVAARWQVAWRTRHLVEILLLLSLVLVGLTVVASQADPNGIDLGATRWIQQFQDPA